MYRLRLCKLRTTTLLLPPLLAVVFSLRCDRLYCFKHARSKLNSKVVRVMELRDLFGRHIEMKDSGFASLSGATNAVPVRRVRVKGSGTSQTHGILNLLPDAGRKPG